MRRTITEADSNFKASVAGIKNWGSSIDSLKANAERLGANIAAQNGIIAKYSEQLNKSKDALEQNKSKMAENKAALDSARSAYEQSSSSIGKNADETKKLKAELDKAEAAYKNSEGLVRSNNASVQGYSIQLNNAKAKLGEMNSELVQNNAKIKENSSSWGKFSDSVASSSDKANKALKGIGIIGASVAAAFGKMLTSSVSSADELQRLSDVTGISAEQLQIMKYQGSALGVELDTMTGAQAKLTKNMNAAKGGTGTAAAAFKELGVSVKDGVTGQLRDSNDVFNDVITKLGGMKNSTERDATAMTIFGKSAMQLNPLIKAGGTELKSMSDEAKKNGAIMSNEAVSGLDSFGDSVDAMKLSIQGAIGQALSKLTPQLSEISNKIKTIDFSGISSGISFIVSHSSAILGSIAGITGAIVAWKVATVAAAAAQEIHNAIVVISAISTGGLAAAQTALTAAKGGTTLATLAATSANVGHTVGTVAAAVATKAQAAAQGLLNAALNANPIGIVIVAITALVAAIVILFNNNKAFHDWVINAFNSIKAIATTVVNTLVTFFTQTIPNAFNSAKSTVLGIWNGIISGITGAWNGFIAILSNPSLLFNAIQAAFSSAITWITNLPSEALQWGKDIIQGIVDGIKSAASAVGDAVKGVAKDIRKFLHFSVPDEGPLVDFNSWMPDMMNQMAQGITANKYKVKQAIEGLSADMSIGVKAQYQPGYAGGYSSNTVPAAKEAAYTFYQYNTSPKALSPAETARQTRNVIKQAVLQSRK